MKEILEQKWFEHYRAFQHTEDEAVKLYHKEMMEMITRTRIRFGGGVL